jgi:DNA-binding NtrC family response regulator
MHKSIVVVAADPIECRELCTVLELNHYRTSALHSLPEAARAIQARVCHAVIVDLDSLPVDNRFIRDLCRNHQELCVIGVSSRRFHPELEEAMRSHISACLSKPVNIEELIYWLRSVCGKDPNEQVSPEAHEKRELPREEKNQPEISEKGRNL